MDHKQQHHEHHQHEREQHKKDKKRHQRAHDKQSSFPIHPMWLLVLGMVLALLAVLIWTFYT